MIRTATERKPWQEVTAAEPCPVCGKVDWCRRSPDGSKVACRRESRGAVKTKRYADGSEAFLHVLRDDWPPGDNGKPKRRPQPSKLTPTATGAPILQPAGEAEAAHGADLARRDAAYRRLLALLPLSPDHRQALQARGLSDADIDAGGYRTLPTNGRSAVVKKLVAELGQDFAAVPGFVTTEHGPRIAAPSGLVVPVRDVTGRVVALKLRPDNPQPDKGKYCYLSSAKYGGPSPGSPAHVPAGVCGPVEVARITEGELKADVAYRLSGVATVSFPGVASWRVVLPVLQALQAPTVRVAFDADAATKRDVARCLLECVKELAAAGYAVELERWPIDAGKGIDDALAAGRGADIERLTADAALDAARVIAAAAGVDASDGDRDGDGEQDRPKSTATLLVELAAVAERWHTTGQGIGYATVPVGDHREHWPIKGQTFKRWLGQQFFKQYGKAPGSQALQDAANVIEGQALYDGAEHAVYVRVAGHGDKLYLDLANGSWQAVEIDADGWRVVPAAPVRFRRAKAMMALPTPTAGGDIGELRRFVNVMADDWPLLLCWLAAAFRPTGPYPVLALPGEQGYVKPEVATVWTQADGVDDELQPLSDRVRVTL